MRIAVIQREDLGIVYGVNRFVFELAKGFKNIGIETHIVAHHMSNDICVKAWGSLDIPVHLISGKPGNLAKVLYDWLMDGSRTLSEIGADCVVMNGAVYLRKDFIKVAVVHGPLKEKVSLFERLLHRFLLKSCDVRIAVSERTALQLEEKLGVKADYIMPVCINVDAFNNLYKHGIVRENTIVHIGLTPNKNPELSIKIVKMLREKGIDARLVLFGMNTSYTRELVKKYSGEHYIEFKLGIAGDEVLRELAKAKALILPSTIETFSYASLEAMALGTPVVVSDAVPPSLVLSGVTGYRVPLSNVSGYVDALEALLVRQELFEELSNNARRHAAEFNCIDIARKYVEIISSLKK
ncbi:MAG: glycosyltransferase family 4 protein [Sulfolobales archaeon]|nr:glycosyltransferase family 4 protein [Sulfolobales archaeon]